MAKLSIQDVLATSTKTDKPAKDTVGTFIAEDLTVTVTNSAGDVVLSEPMVAQCFGAKEDKNGAKTSGIGWRAGIARGAAKYQDKLPLFCNLMVMVEKVRLSEGDELDLTEETEPTEQ